MVKHIKASTILASRVFSSSIIVGLQPLCGQKVQDLNVAHLIEISCILALRFFCSHYYTVDKAFKNEICLT